ncbi:MAG: GntR family transcriptional regulator [Alphaproteobacteria bacterium]|nr:GntR family transcriptional regulator [Alphaproteobacteria bacterium]
MEITIDTNGILPIYQQIVRQISNAVVNGKLLSGHNLPSIRQLANDLALNHNTVAKAYKQLEGQRVILTAGRKGTFIHRQAIKHIKQNNQREAEFLLTELMQSFKQSGISPAEVTQLLKQQLDNFKD